jgi:hypothetical protein
MSNIEIEGLSDEIAPPDYYVTRDEKQVAHWITDEQLMKLSSGGKDRSFEVFLASISIALGFVQNFIAASIVVYGGAAPSSADFLLSIVFVVAFTTAIVAGASAKWTRKELDEIIEKIKSRKQTRIPPGGGPRVATHIDLGPPEKIERAG